MTPSTQSPVPAAARPEAAQPPAIECVICATPMAAILQPNLMPGRAGIALVTCENPACPMHGYTLAAASYPPDLTLYLAPKVEYAS